MMPLPINWAWNKILLIKTEKNTHFITFTQPIQRWSTISAFDCRTGNISVFIAGICRNFNNIVIRSTVLTWFMVIGCQIIPIYRKRCLSSSMLWTWLVVYIADSSVYSDDCVIITMQSIQISRLQLLEQQIEMNAHCVRSVDHHWSSISKKIMHFYWK